MVTPLTDFSEALVLVDVTVQGYGSVCSLLQECVCWVTVVCVFLDGLQEEGVTSDSLHGHHQEETQGGGIYVRPEDIQE